MSFILSSALYSTYVKRALIFSVRAKASLTGERERERMRKTERSIFMLCRNIVTVLTQ